jgi:hypothetical protein
MNDPDHYVKAEELAAEAATALKKNDPPRAAILAAIAQVHATLALADAARFRTTQIRGGHEDHTLYSFDQEPGPGPEG